MVSALTHMSCLCHLTSLSDYDSPAILPPFWVCWGVTWVDCWCVFLQSFLEHFLMSVLFVVDRHTKLHIVHMLRVLFVLECVCVCVCFLLLFSILQCALLSNITLCLLVEAQFFFIIYLFYFFWIASCLFFSPNSLERWDCYTEWIKKIKYARAVVLGSFWGVGVEDGGGGGWLQCVLEVNMY